jgi:hypothetical protein
MVQQKEELGSGSKYEIGRVRNQEHGVLVFKEVDS